MKDKRGRIRRFKQGHGGRPNWRSFEEAREFVRSLGIKNGTEWRRYCKSGEKPKDIPRSFDTVYRNKGFMGYPDFFGYERRGIRSEDIFPFEEANRIVRSLGIKNSVQYDKLGKQGKLPKGLPKDPYFSYKNKGWISFPDFLGYKSKRLLPFEQARELVRTLDIKSKAEYDMLRKQGKLPDGLPSNPYQTYENNGWGGYPDFFGHDFNFLPFEEARRIVRLLGIKSVLGYYRLKKQGKLPKGVPSSPRNVYKNKGWMNWYDFLGLKKPAKILPFEKARKITRSLNIKTVAEYRKLAKQGKLPDGLPSDPATIYKKMNSTT